MECRGNAACLKSGGIRTCTDVSPDECHSMTRNGSRRRNSLTRQHFYRLGRRSEMPGRCHAMPRCARERRAPHCQCAANGDCPTPAPDLPFRNACASSSCGGTPDGRCSTGTPRIASCAFGLLCRPRQHGCPRFCRCYMCENDRRERINIKQAVLKRADNVG